MPDQPIPPTAGQIRTTATPSPSFAEHLAADERNQLDARAACAEQERDDALDDLSKTREQLADAYAAGARSATEAANLREQLNRANTERQRLAQELATMTDIARSNKRHVATLTAIVDAVQQLSTTWKKSPIGTQEHDCGNQLERALAAPPVRPGSSRRAQDGHAQGYAEAVARLRDDERYRNWWTSDGVKPDGPIRQHLADYLETVGPDGVDVETGRWPAREQAVIRAAIAWRVWYGGQYDPTRSSACNDLAAAVDALPHTGEPQPEQPTKAPWPWMNRRALVSDTLGRALWKHGHVVPLPVRDRCAEAVLAALDGEQHRARAEHVPAAAILFEEHGEPLNAAAVRDLQAERDQLRAAQGWDPSVPPFGWGYMARVDQLMQRVRPLIADSVPVVSFAELAEAADRVDAERAKLTPAGIERGEARLRELLPQPRRSFWHRVLQALARR